MLEDHDRIRVFDGCKQHALGIIRRRRLDNLQSRYVTEPRFKTLAVLSCSAGAGTSGKAHDQRYRHRTAKHVTDFRSLIDNLFHRKRGKIRKLELEDRAHACQCRADGNASTAEFRDRSVHHPVLSETVHEVPGYLKGTAIDADVLAHKEHAIIGLHGNCHGFLDRLRIAQLADHLVHGQSV